MHLGRRIRVLGAGGTPCALPAKAIRARWRVEVFLSTCGAPGAPPWPTPLPAGLRCGGSTSAGLSYALLVAGRGLAGRASTHPELPLLPRDLLPVPSAARHCGLLGRGRLASGLGEASHIVRLLLGLACASRRLGSLSLPGSPGSDGSARLRSGYASAVSAASGRLGCAI